MTQEWISSTLVFVSDVDAAIAFYVERLDFALNMRFEHEGTALVAGVSRGDGCALLLTCQWPDKVGKAVLYTALDRDDFDSWRALLNDRGIASEEGFWGKPLLIVHDPDGNQLYFPFP